MAKSRQTVEPIEDAPAPAAAKPGEERAEGAPLSVAEKAAAQIAELDRRRDSGAPKPKLGQVANADPDYRYYWFSTRSSIGERGLLGDGVLSADRQMLKDKFYEPVNGPLYAGEERLEYVPGVPTAEIWRTPRATWKHRRKQKREKLYTSTDRNARIWRETQAARQAPRGAGFLPPEVIDEMKGRVRPKE